MNDFVYFLGFFVMGLSSLFVCALLVGLIANFVWQRIVRVRSMLWLGKAIRHYSAIEAPPKGEDK